MAVFEDLDPVARKRLEDPEARKVEQIERVGNGIDVKKKSSGVKVSSYFISSKILGIALGLGGVLAIFGLAFYGVMLFING